MREPTRPFYGIDPGPEKSALVAMRGLCIDHAVWIPNGDLLAFLDRLPPISVGGPPLLAVEKMVTYGMPVGAQVLDTCVWIGRFVQAYEGPHMLIRPDNIRIHICRDPRANKGTVRQALIDMFPATGGGKRPVIGTKKQPGPLYGFSNHLWSALAVAVTARDMADPNYGRKMRK